MSGATAIIDAHHHFWDLGLNNYPWLSQRQAIPFRYGNYDALRRNYLPPDYRRDIGDYNVTGTVHIEADHDHQAPLKETFWLEQIKMQSGLPSVCVAFAALDAPNVDEVLSAQASRPLVRGIRHKLESSASPSEARRGVAGSLDDPVWRQGFARLSQYGLSFDLQTAWWHMDAVADLATDFPQTRIVINHSGLPADRSLEGLNGWRKAMSQLADKENVSVKISGLGVPGQAWSLQSNGPIIHNLISIFSAQRCMFASNYPVDSLCANYEEIISVFLLAIEHLEPQQQIKILSESATEFYRMTNIRDEASAK